MTRARTVLAAVSVSAVSAVSAVSLALAACDRHAIPEDVERLTVTVDAVRSDAVVDGLNAELRELAAPERPGAPPAFGFRVTTQVEAMSVLHGNEVNLGIYLKAFRELSRRHAELTFQIAFDPGAAAFAMRAGSCGAWDAAFDHLLAGLHVPPPPARGAPPEPAPPRAATLPALGAVLADKAIVAGYVVEPSGALHDVAPAALGDPRVVPAPGQLLDDMTGAVPPAVDADHAIRALAYASTGEAVLEDRWSEAPGREVSQLRLVAADGRVRSSPRAYEAWDYHLTADRTQLVYRCTRDGSPTLVRLALATLQATPVATPRGLAAFALDEDGHILAFVGETTERRIVELEAPAAPAAPRERGAPAASGEPRELGRVARGKHWALLAADRSAVWMRLFHAYVRAPDGRYHRRYDLVRLDRATGATRKLIEAIEDVPGDAHLARADRGWYAVTASGLWLVDERAPVHILPADPDPHAIAAIAAAPDGLLAVLYNTIDPAHRAAAPPTSALALYRGTAQLVAPTEVPVAWTLSFRNAAR